MYYSYPVIDQEKATDPPADFSRFASALIHELRNPLTAISLSLDQLIKTTNLSSTEGEDLETAKRETERLEAILKQFADFGTPAPPNFHTIVPEKLLLDIKENWKIALGGRKASLRIKVELRPDSFIEGDSKLLRLALGNLIQNAIESLGQNGWVSIKLSNGSLQSDNGQENAVIFSIEDNGSGITSDMPERILEPFFSTRRMKVGLGLPIVVRIVQQHRGQFSFHSERNQGSLFKITLPTLQTGRLYV